jgi:peptidoglycan/LPS O-acetylase OafA/YrhL
LVLPLWSLTYEARLSLVFPILAMLTLRWPRMAGWVVMFGLCLELVWWMEGKPAAPLYADGLSANVMVTLHFAILFVMGIAVAVRAPRLSFDRTRAMGIGVLAIILLVAGSDTTMGVGAALVIELVIGTPGLSRWLCHPILRWFGRISYSLYLIHVPILVSFCYGFGYPLPTLLVIFAIGICLLAAELMFRTIERPSIAAGRWMTQQREGCWPTVTWGMPPTAPEGTECRRR